MSEKKYKMSFTIGGLFYNESLIALAMYLSLLHWKKVRARMLSDNLLQTRTKSSAIRISREICQRLETLTRKQLQLLESGSAREQRYLLWIAICKRYAFIHQFMGEMVREKYARMDLQLSPGDYDIFFHEKAEIHVELDHLSASTRTKLRQVLFKTMREAEILSRDNMILPGLPTKELLEALTDDSPGLLAMLPISDMDIKEWLK